MLYQWRLLGGPSGAGNFGLGLLLGGAGHQLLQMSRDLSHADATDAPLPISSATLGRAAPLLNTLVVGAMVGGAWLGCSGLYEHNEGMRCVGETAMVLGIVASCFVNAVSAGRLAQR